MMSQAIPKSKKGAGKTASSSEQREDGSVKEERGSRG